MTDVREIIGFLFDLDGVIIDSEREYSKIWAQINREFPTGVHNFEYVIKGTTLSNILQTYFVGKSLQEKVSRRLHELENQMHYDYLPHAFDFLKKLKDFGMKCALVTSSETEKMNHLFEELPEIKDFFEIIITGNQVKTSKPSPEGYLLAATGIKRDPRKCVVFEDSLQGVKAGKQADAFVIGIAGTLTREALQPHSNKVIFNFNELNLSVLIQKLAVR